MLGVRESRRFKGKITFFAKDIFDKTYENSSETACITDYPIDIHSNQKDDSTLQQINEPYSLPVDALKNSKFENLYVIGRCLSADFAAQASLRVQKNCFSMGEAAAKNIAKRL